MIRDFEFFHGCVLAGAVHASAGPLSIRRFDESENAAYVLDNKRGLYIKYCTKRLSPWRFTFQRAHCDTILRMSNECEKVYVALVCKDDGVAILNLSEFRAVTESLPKADQWISAARRAREMYTIKGSSGELPFKVGLNEFNSKMFLDEY